MQPQAVLLKNNRGAFLSNLEATSQFTIMVGSREGSLLLTYHSSFTCWKKQRELARVPVRGQ